jgi:hypothetical protein
LQKTECAPEEKIYNVVSGCIEGSEFTFLLQDDAILSVPLEIVLYALPDVEEEDVEGYIVGLCRPSATVKCTSRGSTVCSIEFM